MSSGMRAAIGIVAVLLTSCKVGPNFSPPHEPVPDHYAGAKPDLAGVLTGTATEAEPDAFWWRQFHDSELDDLEKLAAAGNLDLKAAYMRIVEARIQVLAARAQGLPSLNASASFNREQLGLAGILKTQGISGAGTAAAGTQQLIRGLEAPVNIYQLGFDASWELDLFGKVRRGVEGAEAQSESAVESRNDLLVTLEAEVAETYLQLRAGQTLRQITRDLIGAQRDVVELTNNKHMHGLAGEAIERLTPGVVDNQHHPSPVANEFHWSQSPFSVQVLPKFALM